MRTGRLERWRERGLERCGAAEAEQPRRWRECWFERCCANAEAEQPHAQECWFERCGRARHPERGCRAVLWPIRSNSSAFRQESKDVYVFAAMR